MLSALWRRRGVKLLIVNDHVNVVGKPLERPTPHLTTQITPLFLLFFRTLGFLPASAELHVDTFAGKCPSGRGAVRTRNASLGNEEFPLGLPCAFGLLDVRAPGGIHGEDVPAAVCPCPSPGFLYSSLVGLSFEEPPDDRNVHHLVFLSSVVASPPFRRSGQAFCSWTWPSTSCLARRG